MTMQGPFGAADSVRAQWDAAAEGWDAQRPVIRRWLCEPTDAMIALARVKPGDHVLDVAAGAGDQSLDLVERVGPEGRVVATDISPAIIARLRERVALAGMVGVEARVADAGEPLPPQEQFGAAICRLGLMLLPEPERCLASVAAALKPEARFCAMVFAGPEDNPCIRILMATALRHAGLPPRDPFAPGGLMSLGRPGRLEELFREAGFRNVVTTRLDAPFRLGSVEEYMAFVRAAAAPVRGVLAGLGPDAQAAAWGEMTEQLRAFDREEAWEGPNTLLLTVGQR